jgi:Tol biopolymer transport system component
MQYGGSGTSGGGGVLGLSQWRSEVVDATGKDYPSLALDSSGRPHISYINGPYGYLKYAYYDGQAWQVETVDMTIGRSYPQDMALDAQDHPHVCYYDYWNADLKYAYRDDAVWHLSTPDSTGDVGQDCSIALDGLGRPHTSYYDLSNGDLKHAFFDGTAWQTEVVDADGNVGRSTSLQVDAAGQLHLSYSDETNTALKYARFDGTAWHIETLDSIWSAIFTSLAVDTAGRPHIVYLSDGLRYAYFNGTAWEFTVLDSTAGAGYFPSIALDTEDRPHITYLDSSRSNILYLYDDGGAWRIRPVASGDQNSLVIAPSGRPAVAYSGNGLEYAVQIGDLADWSRIAFSRYMGPNNYDVFSARGDGAGPFQMTSHSAIDTRPDINRGATQYIFDSRRDGNYNVYKMNADGSGQTRLTANSFNEYRPQWSPDGTKIIYYGYPDTTENAEIYVMNADGSGQTRLTWDPSWDGHPTWSPDGSQVAFVSNRGVAGTYHIWTMSPDGSNQQQVGTVGWDYLAYPDWSPDGTQFVANTDINGDGWLDLVVISADGMTSTFPVGASPAYYDYATPKWSPDGHDIVFDQVQWTTCGSSWCWIDAYVIGLDPSQHLSYFLTDSGLDWWPAWEGTDLIAPSSQVPALPTWSGGSFTVAWWGGDEGGSGIDSYDVQYRDGEGGAWVDWLLDTGQTAAVFTGEDGHTYYFRCRARDYAGNLEPYPDGPEAWTTVDVSPPTSAASSPPYATGTSFLVTWSGTDSGSGLATYDLQYRDGSGAWTAWFSQTTVTSASFTGQPGHTYYFQSRARDLMGNLEPYPGGNGDTQTHLLTYALQGFVLNTQDEAVAVARVVATPPLSDTAYSLVDGSFTLHGDAAGTYDLSVVRSGFGTLPAMRGVPMPSSQPPIFYLPPSDDRSADGGFEAGDLAAWAVTGTVAPTLTAPGHTGTYAARFGGPVPPPIVTPTAVFTASAVVTAAGGVVTSSLAVLTVPTGTVSGTAVFTLTGVPTVTGLPAGTQDVGAHLAWQAALTDGTPLTATLRPVTVTVSYSDGQWQAAQVAGEETLRLWWYDPVSATWVPLSGTLDVVSNTVTVTATRPGRFALLGAPYTGPWAGTLSQEMVLGPVESATLSLLYQVVGTAPPSTTLAVYVAGPSTTVTYTLPLTASGWVHRWWEVPTDLGPTVTVRLAWTQGGREAAVLAVVDEISLGTAAVGGYAVYLPLLRR